MRQLTTEETKIISRMVTKLSNAGVRSNGHIDLELEETEVIEFFTALIGGIGRNGTRISTANIHILIDTYFSHRYLHYTWVDGKIVPDGLTIYRYPLFKINPENEAWEWVEVKSYRQKPARSRRHRAMRPLGKKDAILRFDLVNSGISSDGLAYKPKPVDVLHVVAAAILGRPLDYNAGEDAKTTSGIDYDVNPLKINITAVESGRGRHGQRHSNSTLSDTRRKNIRKQAAEGVTTTALAKKYKRSTRNIRQILASDRSDERIIYVKRIDRNALRLERMVKRDAMLVQRAQENGITWAAAMVSYEAAFDKDWPVTESWLKKWKLDTGRDWDWREAAAGARATTEGETVNTIPVVDPQSGSR
jgi:hypothetical protein